MSNGVGNLVGTQAQVGKNDVDPRQSCFGGHFVEAGEVGLKQSCSFAVGSEALCSGLQVLLVEVEPEQTSPSSGVFEQLAGVAASTDRAVEDHDGRSRVQQFDHLRQ